MQWAGVGMWMVFGLSACSPTKTEIGNLNVIPQPQEVSQDIQAHLLLLIRKPVLSIRKAMKSCNGRQNFSFLY